MPNLGLVRTTYNIENSNIALLGSELEHRVREHAGESEPEWESAGIAPGIQAWRIEQFQVKPWPKDKLGTFYDGDSYIVLHTYVVKPDTEELAYDLHFWLGHDTSTDEAGTAAYKTVELDDHLHSAPVQYREIQGYESQLFLSYFPKFLCLQGGVATGFHHVSEPPENAPRLFAIKSHPDHGNHSLVYQLPLQGGALNSASVFILDKGEDIWQFNRKRSLGKERFQAAEFVRSLADARKGQGNIQVYDEGGPGAGIFLSEVGADLSDSVPEEEAPRHVDSLWRLDGDGFVKLNESPKRSNLESTDIFLLDLLDRSVSPALFVWIGSQTKAERRRRAIQVGQDFLNQHRDDRRNASIICVNEGRESAVFLNELLPEI